ncbi:MAG: hypothetical protein MJH10_12665 [Epibacterium sp.]|nr:hypothetical protein [Epibacterium sp.]NQX74397.1 hypothetical protein [Epibacterium sp.]
MTRYQHSILRVFLPCFCICAMLATLAMGQTLDGQDPNLSNPLPDGTGQLRDIPVLEDEDGFVPQLVRREPQLIKAPQLIFVVKEPVEISAPDLLFVVKEPIQVSAPDLVFVVKEPEDIAAPELVFVVEEDTENQEGASEPETSSTSTDLDDKTGVGPPICVGEYTLHSSGAVGKGIGPDGKPVPNMPVGTPVMAKATLSTESCGEFLTMKSQGQSIQLARQHGGDNVYVGELKMPDGVTRILQLTCGRDLSMHGVLDARDANIKLQRPMWLRAVNTTTLASCLK